MREGWNFEHDCRHQVSFATLIRDGQFVTELSADGHDHMARISDVIADWEVDQQDSETAVSELRARA